MHSQNQFDGQSAQKPVRRVAIVGVHGVGYHEAGATENAMADLLLSLPSYEPPPDKKEEQPAGRAQSPGGHRATPPGKLPPQGKNEPCYYGSFRGVEVQIQLAPVKVPEVARAEAESLQRALGPYDETSVMFAAGAKMKAKREGRSLSESDPGVAADGFTSLLLWNYLGAADGNAYVTKRLEGERNASAPKGEAEVHIYEVLWADLATSTNSLLRFFLALFQLILHLGTLSRTALDTSAAECNNTLWKIFRRLQRYAVRVLQIFLPLFKIVLLIALIACAPARAEALRDAIWLPPVLWMIAGPAISFLARRKSNRKINIGPWLWAGLGLLSASVGLAIGWLSTMVVSPATASSIALWILIGIPLLDFILSKYNSVRHGVEITGWIVYALFFAVFLANLTQTKSSLEAGFWMMQWLLAAVRVSWGVLILLAFVTLVLGAFAWRSAGGGTPAAARARAAVRTSRFALALPSFLFAAFTALIWASLFKLADWVSWPFFPEEMLYKPIPWGEWLRAVGLVPDPMTMRDPPINCDYLRGALAWSIGYQAPVSLALFMVALFLMGWWLLPSLVTEENPPRNKKEPPRVSTNDQSVRLGTWCSRGLDSTSVLTAIFWIAAFLTPAAYAVLEVTNPDQSLNAWLRSATQWMVVNWIILIAGAVVAALVRYGSPVLGAVLDVDNYLRSGPESASPRAKIYERYVSMLRYLAAYRGPDGRGYDQVILVAHSLGALISADLLHYLHRNPDAELASLNLGTNNSKVILMTMGNPLRQLLNRFFPYLYQWVRPRPDNPLPTAETTPPSSFPVTDPDPGKLGVAKWISIYRSGDYIGRSLWLDEWYQRTATPTGAYPQRPVYKVTDGVREEMCIGAGGHIHYWDDTAPDVAQRLNDLI
jgi:hypothetical protein